VVTRKLLIVGAGGFARETAQAVHAVNDVRPTWELVGHLDDDPRLAGTAVSGIPVVGPVAAVEDHPDAAVVICTGRPDSYTSRRAIAGRLGLPDDRYATVLHPTVAAARSCAVAPGSVLLAHVACTADVVVGRHVAVMPHVVLTHDVRVDDWATLASGVRLGGGVHVGEGAYVGSAVAVREGTRVGPWAMVGMAAVVTRDVPAGRLWYGTPARDVSAAPLPPNHLIASDTSEGERT
jgi:sugar O-acyltransferase (sialic acid O-acetyltransferase NeuD family)